ncbi:MAG TPA: hypothetical protein VFG14_15135 [Chthoniobacteraceae bacterium]|nr:hypothetical protein [Chthoniobacteraceae bacterium]
MLTVPRENESKWTELTSLHEVRAGQKGFGEGRPQWKEYTRDGHMNRCTHWHDGTTQHRL